MTSYTARMSCPRCDSEDCNITIEKLGSLIVASIRKRTIHCNSCGYSKVSLIVQNKEVCAETRLSGEEEDTDLEYKYLGREKG